MRPLPTRLTDTAGAPPSFATAFAAVAAPEPSPRILGTERAPFRALPVMSVLHWSAAFTGLAPLHDCRIPNR